jgi:hypothetical protein
MQNEGVPRQKRKRLSVIEKKKKKITHRVYHFKN